MTNQCSYNIENFSINRNREIQRLNAQLDLFWDQEHALYRKLGLKDGMKILDCGCGPGYLLEKLHNNYPSMSCWGIEISNTLYDIAQENAKKLDRCKIYRQSITEMGFQSESFDFVIVRLVIEHLSDPYLALREVFRVLKDKGRAVFIANDFDYHVRTFPDISELSDLYKSYCEARINDGGNPRIGRQLPYLLKNCGYVDISFNVISAHNALTGDDAFIHSEGSGITLQLVRNGFLPNEKYDQLAVQWSSMLKTNDHSIVRLLFAGSGKKGQKIIEDINLNKKIAETKGTKHTNSNQQLNLANHLVNGTIIDGLILAAANAMEISPDLIQSDCTLGSIGIDSIASVTFQNRLESELNFILPSLEYLNNHSINDLATMIKKHISETDLLKNTKDNSIIEFEEGEI